MAAKKKSKGHQNTSIKVNNKQNNKLVKLSKKKKKKQEKKKYRQSLDLSSKEDGNVNKTATHDAENEDEYDELEAADVKYFSRQGRDLSFADIPKDWSKEQNNRKRKFASNDDNDEMEYEEVPRKLLARDKNANMKMLLPIKGDKGKVIRRMIESTVADEENQDPSLADEDEEGPQSDAVEVEKPLRPLSNVELFATRRKKLEERKQTIALLATSILEDPQENIRRLRDLREMLNEKEPDLYITVRKLVMVSLMEVFKDIVPGYKIRLPTDQEKAQQLKKETRSLYDFESALLLNYKQYLEHLELTLKGGVPSNKKGPVLTIPKDVSIKVAELSCKCMCEMLVHHPHFNYTTNIIAVLVPLMRRGAVFAEPVIGAVTMVFREDKAGYVTLELVRSIGKMVKSCDYHVKPAVLNTYLSLKIREVDMTTSGGNRKVERRKEQLKKMSRRERKRKKAMDKINQELQEVQATEDKNKKLKLHTEIIDAVFVTYFRILKNATQSVLLPSVLEGLAKFAHLINIEFFDDLFKVFQQLISSDTLTYRESLHCVQTAFTILTGQGSSLNIDPMAFYRDLYQTLFRIHAGSSSSDLPIIFECLELMINKRRKQVSQQRVLAYTKRLCTMALQQLPHSMLGLLSAVRGLVQTFKYTDRLFDNEAEGSGVFRPDIEDPEHCNAHNTTVWELSLLRHHFHPVVRQYSSHVGCLAPSTGEGQLSHSLARLSPLELYNKYDLTSNILDNSLPKKTQARKKKFRTRGFHNEDLATYIQTVTSGVPDHLSSEVTMEIG